MGRNKNIGDEKEIKKEVNVGRKEEAKWKIVEGKIVAIIITIIVVIIVTMEMYLR